ncbi:MAG: hypothetical protein U0165_16535 [Polyangiaceae bacterium]
MSYELPRNQLVVITGPSGSGKSSLAFDTIYAGAAASLRRIPLGLCPAALEQLAQARCHLIEGLSPAIAIEQRARLLVALA